MAQEQDEDLVRVFDLKNLPTMLGSEKFISWIKDRFFKKKIDKDRKFINHFECIESTT